jgi:transglutaminase-like putative cysteine protease
MTMTLRIVHTTTFDYDGRATASYNQLRMTPLTMPGQIVSHTRVEISPTPWVYDYRDYFGTAVTAFEVLDPHESMTVTATSTVHTDRPPSGMPAMGWEDLDDPAVSDALTEYLVVSPSVALHPELEVMVGDVRSGAAMPGDAAREVCSLVHREVDYRVGATDVHTRAADAWEQRAGVCQDMAHLSIGALRSLGIPARYVSGYFHPTARPVVGEQVAGESHAWVEWWDQGWHAFDPTNATEPGDRYVVVATGRDYADVKPLSGIFSGAKTSGMSVEVAVTRLG